MKTHIKVLHSLAILYLTGISFSVIAQQQMQYFRPNNENGLNVFETTKNDSTPFTKLKVKVGGNFEVAFQGLKDWNTATPLTKPGFNGNVNNLMPLTNGCDLPMANLNVDAQLYDGIRVSLSLYMASRHHEDAWVKGGYAQLDKLTFLNSEFVNNIMKSITIKVGQFDVDYGDQHYQRSDGGNTMYNPFVENYIMDEFATELGTEVYYHNKCGFFLMGGITNGELDPTVIAATKIDSATGHLNSYDAAFHGKIGYDRQVSKDFRFRITGSFYTDQSANSNTLFGGDRTGSHYYDIMSNQNVANGTVLSDANDYNPFSGRYNPGFSEQVNAFMGNLLLKFKGLQFFGTYEIAQGRTITEKTDRQAVQYAGDLIYRFPKNKENFWVGIRYNSVTAAMQGVSTDIIINREAASMGWFVTENIMLKAEYVNQVYQNYASTNILNGGKFGGYMLEASIGF
jgi:hypothetical protein